MAGSFLSIELDPLGLTAAIIEQRNKSTLVKDLCHVLFDDLPDADEDKDPFDAGMEWVAQKLDLKMCSSAVIFMSPFLLSFRNISLPFSSKKKIEQVLSFELETVLPHSKKNYISDFHVLNIEDEPHLMLTASVPESTIETLFKGLEKYNIKPVIITHNGYAAAVNFLNVHADVTTCVFVYITKTAITLVLVMNQIPCMVKVLSTHKYSPETIVMSVNRMIIGFQQRTGIDTYFDIFISTNGHGEDIDTILVHLKESFKNSSRLTAIEPETHRTLIQKETDESPVLLSEIAPDTKINYLFNFCKGKYGASSLFEVYSRYIAVGLILVFLTFSLAMININIDISHLENKIAGYDHKALSIFRTTFPGTQRVQDPYLQMKANVLAAIKKSGTRSDNINTGRSVTIVTILNELSQRVESSIDMEISRFLFNENRIVIAGSTDNFNNVDKIKNKLEASDLFGNVSISSAAADKKEGRVNFKFIIEI